MPNAVIYIRDHLFDKWKELENKSEVVNNALTDYFRKNELRNMTPEEIEKKKKLLKAKLAYEQAIEEIKNEN